MRRPLFGRGAIVKAPVKGREYRLVCFDQAGKLVYARVITYDPGDPLAGVAVAQRAADMAVGQLELALPEVSTSPPLGTSQIVGIPTWFWVDNPWADSSASASLGAVTSAVSARPLSVTFDTGDGDELSCTPGTRYDPAKAPADQHSDCTHVYIQPGDYTITATITWQVSWSATTGEAGDLGQITRTTSIPLHVVEVQAFIR